MIAPIGQAPLTLGERVLSIVRRAEYDREEELADIFGNAFPVIAAPAVYLGELFANVGQRGALTCYYGIVCDVPPVFIANFQFGGRFRNSKVERQLCLVEGFLDISKDLLFNRLRLFEFF